MISRNKRNMVLHFCFYLYFPVDAKHLFSTLTIVYSVRPSKTSMTSMTSKTFLVKPIILVQFQLETSNRIVFWVAD